MNALTSKLPAHDDKIEDTSWGDYDLSGELLVEYDEGGYTSGDERFITDCEVTIIGLHVGGNFVIEREGLEQIATTSYVENFEAQMASDRISA